MQAGELQPVADLAQQVVVDIFDRKHDRRRRIARGEIAVGADRHRRDDRGLVAHPLDHGSEPAGLMRILGGEEGDRGIRPGVETPAQILQNLGQLGRQIDRANVTGAARAAILDMIVAVDDKHQVVAEENLKPIADPAFGP